MRGRRRAGRVGGGEVRGSSARTGQWGEQRALEGVYTYGEVSRRSWDAKLRIECMDGDGIDVSVLYPTQMLAIQAHREADALAMVLILTSVSIFALYFVNRMTRRADA